MPAISDELCFHVEQWSDDGNRVETLLSMSCNALIAQGAFFEAVKLRPHKRLFMRHRARVINSHIPENFQRIDAQKREELERMIAEAREKRAG